MNIFRMLITLVIVGLVGVGTSFFYLRDFANVPNSFFVKMQLTPSPSGELIDYGGSLLIFTTKSDYSFNLDIEEDPKYELALEDFVINGKTDRLLALLKEEPLVHSVYHHKKTTADETGFAMELLVDQDATNFAILAQSRNPAGYYGYWYANGDEGLPEHVTDPSRTRTEYLYLRDLDGESPGTSGEIIFEIEAVSQVQKHHAATPVYER